MIKLEKQRNYDYYNIVDDGEYFSKDSIAGKVFFNKEQLRELYDAIGVELSIGKRYEE